MIIKNAFTLAEVLITLAVIGIVAALTLPGLIQNHNEKAWSTAKDLWEKKLTETVRRMNVDGVMTGHDSTEDFMNTFKNYMKVIKTCDNSEHNKCYSPEFVLTGKRDNLEKKYIEDFKTAGDLGITDWNTNTMSFVVADGTTVIMAYNPKCPYADPVEDTGSQVSCISMMIDVNGKKSPNRVGKDILLSNATISTCDNPIGDMCWSTDFAANTPLDTTLDENKQYDENYASTTNYWAWAKKKCQDMNMSLPTMRQLAQLASEIYIEDGNQVIIADDEDKSGLTLKPQYLNSLTYDKYYFSIDEESTNFAFVRSFSSSSTTIYSYGKYVGTFRRAICIGN